MDRKLESHRRTAGRRLQMLPVLLAATLVGVALAAPAGADWIVTREGARIETRGPWKEKGKLVVFTQKDGTLASMKADLVDLGASRKATAEKDEPKAKPEQEAAKPRRPSVRSLTDKDFRKSAPAPGEAPPADGQAAPADGKAPVEGTTDAGGAPAAEARQEPLEVASWERAEGGQGVRLTGLLRNTSADQAAGIELEVGLYDENGALLARQKATVESESLGPGESTPFSVEVPGVFAFGSVKFKMRSAGFRVRAVPPSRPSS
jgi:hypothetical protein